MDKKISDRLRELSAEINRLKLEEEQKRKEKENFEKKGKREGLSTKEYIQFLLLNDQLDDIEERKKELLNNQQLEKDKAEFLEKIKRKKEQQKFFRKEKARITRPNYFKTVSDYAYGKEEYLFGIGLDIFNIIELFVKRKKKENVDLIEDKLKEERKIEQFVKDWLVNKRRKEREEKRKQKENENKFIDLRQKQKTPKFIKKYQKNYLPNIEILPQNIEQIETEPQHEFSIDNSKKSPQLIINQKSEKKESIGIYKLLFEKLDLSNKDLSSILNIVKQIHENDFIKNQKILEDISKTAVSTHQVITEMMSHFIDFYYDQKDKEEEKKSLITKIQRPEKINIETPQTTQQKGGQSLLSSLLIGGVGGISNRILTSIKNLPSMAGALTKAVKFMPAISGIIAGVSEFFNSENILKSLAVGGGTFAGTFFGAKLGAGIGSFFGPGVGTIIGSILGSVIGAFLGEKGTKAIYDYLSTIDFAGMWNKITDYAKETWDSIKEFSLKTWDFIFEKGKEIWNSFSQTISKFFADITKNINEFIKNKIEGVGDYTKKTIEDTGNYLKRTTEKTIQDTGNYLKRTTEKTIQVAKTVNKDYIQPTIQKVQEKTKPYVETAVKAAQPIVENLPIDPVKKDIQRVATQISEFSKKIKTKEQLANYNIIRNELDLAGIGSTSKIGQAIVGKIFQESGFTTKEENIAGYQKTSNKRLRIMFASLREKTDQELNQMKQTLTPEQFAEAIYGKDTKIGKQLGNIKEGDGWRYRGRGFIQLTGRANYRRYGKMIGEDLENNPDLMNDPKIAMKVTLAYLKDRGLNKLNEEKITTEEAAKEILKMISGSHILNTNYGKNELLPKLLSDINKMNIPVNQTSTTTVTSAPVIQQESIPQQTQELYKNTKEVEIARTVAPVIVSNVVNNNTTVPANNGAGSGSVPHGNIGTTTNPDPAFRKLLENLFVV